MPHQSVAEFWIHELYMTSFRYFTVAGTVFLLFYVLFRGWTSRRKIQAQFPKLTDYRRDIFFSAVSMCIFASVGLITLKFLRPWTHVYADADRFGTVYYAFTFIWMFFLHDTYFYWTHRLMHHPKIYPYVHLVHHRSTNPSPWTAYAFHPIEAVLEALILPLIAFTLPVHLSAVKWYMIFQIGYNVYGHLGYEIFPKAMSRHWLGKWFNTSVAHNMHHKFFVNNYGLWTTIWDRWMGTLHPKYETLYEQTTGRSATIMEPELRTAGSDA